MANLNEYICWRGDLDFVQSPPNEVDGLLLSYLAYVPFDEIVTSPWEEDRITLYEASRRFWQEHTEQEVLHMISLTKMSPFVMRRMAESRRFGELKLCYYQNSLTLEEESQFSALCVEVPDYITYIIYRGTDNSLIGWKENLKMSYQIVPAQKKAVNYMNYIGEKLRGDFIVCGHSKGGNLATYASAMAKKEIQNRILAVYNYDGPGFMESFLNSAGYHRIQLRNHKLVPAASMIGMMLGNDTHYTIVESDEKGIRQHDPLKWRIVGTEFSKTKMRTKQSYATEDGMRVCLAGLDCGEKERIIDLIFGVFREEELLSMDDIRTIFRTKKSRNAWLLTHKKLKDNPDMKKLLHGVNQAFLLEFSKEFFDGLESLPQKNRHSE